MSSETPSRKERISMPDDDFPDPSDEVLAQITDSYTDRSEVRSAIASAANGRRLPAETDISESITGLGMLALGGLIFGSAELRKRMAETKAAIQEDRKKGVAPSVPPDELARYAAIGLALKTPALLEAGLSRVTGVADTAAGMVTGIASPLTNSFLFRPIRTRYDSLADRGASVVAELAALGVQGEKYSKELVETTAFGTMSDVVDVVVENEEVRDLVQQQTIGLAQEFLMYVQDRLQDADLMLQRIVFKIVPGDQADRKLEPVIEIPVPARSPGLVISAELWRRQP